ncbi:hypothetical protein [Nonomuraea sp. NPDC050786]|uniref:hypothetical protein n=1 Tax=Nonomuraea sp. NPDC050786 TaxID=3154840 RepID=UPI0033C0A41B
MTQLNETPTTIGPAEVEVQPVEAADFMKLLARSVARDLDVLALATGDAPEMVAAAAEDAATGMDSLINMLMQAEGLTVEEAQSRAAALIAEQGEGW